MKQKILIGIITGLFLTACSSNKEKIVSDFLTASNKFDKEKVGQLLSDNFVSVDANGIKYNKSSYLNRVDSFKYYETITGAVSIKDFDSIVKTEERIVTMVDSLLDITPKVVTHKTYKIKDDKIISINTDSTLNYEEHQENLNEKIIPFTFWAESVHDVKNEKQAMRNLKKYLTEYNQLSITDKKNYRTYSRLQGTYISKDSKFYRKLIFKGKTTVVVVDAFFGMSFPSSYVLDEDYIRIRTDKSDLLLQIKDNNTIVGEGFASGTFSKLK